MSGLNLNIFSIIGYEDQSHINNSVFKILCLIPIIFQSLLLFWFHIQCWKCWIIEIHYSQRVKMFISNLRQVLIV